MSEEQPTYELSGAAVPAARLNAMTVKMADLEERIDRLIVGQRELREQRNDPRDVMERIADTLEAIREEVERIKENQIDVQERSNGVWAVRTVTAG